jgi:hypothetical protein
MEGRLLSSHPMADSSDASNPTYVQTYKCGTALSPDGAHMVTCTGLQARANIVSLYAQSVRSSRGDGSLTSGDGGSPVVEVGTNEANVTCVDWSNVAYKSLGYDSAIVSGTMDGNLVVNYLNRVSI